MPTLRTDLIRLTHVQVPLNEPFVISSGAITHKDAILIEISADGLTGYGEASPMSGPFYSRHTPESSWAALIEQAIPILRQQGRYNIRESPLAAELDDPYAAAGLDAAMWDLVAKSRAVPLGVLLGGNMEQAIESGLAVGITETVEELLLLIAHYLAQGGYRRVKIKVQPDWDEVPLKAIRDHFGDISLMVDANCAYGPEDISRLAAWDRFGLVMIEQPFSREAIALHADLARACCTPICLDESAEDPETVSQAIKLGAADIVNIKLQRVGSYASALSIHDLCAQAGIGCWMGTMPELGLGAYAAMHFASLPNIRYPTDVEASRRWFAEDITDPPVKCSDGLLTLPEGAGLGVKLDLEAVERYTIRKAEYPLALYLDSSIAKE